MTTNSNGSTGTFSGAGRLAGVAGSKRHQSSADQDGLLWKHASSGLHLGQPRLIGEESVDVIGHLVGQPPTSPG